MYAFLVLVISALLQLALCGEAESDLTLCQKDFILGWNHVNRTTLKFKPSAFSVGKIFSYANIKITSKGLFKASKPKEQSNNDSSWFAPILSSLNSGKMREYYQKVSCLDNFSLDIAFDETSGTYTVDVSTKNFDEISFLFFIVGCLLFMNAKSLTRSATFLYSSCASLGVATSLIIVLFILFKLLPYKRPMSFLLLTGSGIWFYFLQHIHDYLWSLVQQYPYYVIGYFTVSAIVSVSLLYYFGLPSNERSLNLLQWFLQLLSIYIIYNSCYSKEFSVTIVILLVTFQYFSFSNMVKRFLYLVCVRDKDYEYDKSEVEESEEDDGEEEEKEEKPLSSSTYSGFSETPSKRLNNLLVGEDDNISVNYSVEKMTGKGDSKEEIYKFLETQSKQIQAVMKIQEQQNELLPHRTVAWFCYPSQTRLLTLEEYQIQGVVETEKALKELSEYCSSPECNTWDVVSKLKDPKRFATYLRTEIQFTPEELDSYYLEEEISIEQKEERPLSSQLDITNDGEIDEWLSDVDAIEGSLNNGSNVPILVD